MIAFTAPIHDRQQSGPYQTNVNTSRGPLPMHSNQNALTVAGYLTTEILDIHDRPSNTVGPASIATLHSKLHQPPQQPIHIYEDTNFFMN